MTFKSAIECERVPILPVDTIYTLINLTWGKHGRSIGGYLETHSNSFIIEQLGGVIVLGMTIWWYGGSYHCQTYVSHCRKTHLNVTCYWQGFIERSSQAWIAGYYRTPPPLWSPPIEAAARGDCGKIETINRCFYQEFVTHCWWRGCLHLYPDQTLC